jgi:hypothetical protein
MGDRLTSVFEQQYADSFSRAGDDGTSFDSVLDESLNEIQNSTGGNGSRVSMVVPSVSPPPGAGDRWSLSPGRQTLFSTFFPGRVSGRDTRFRWFATFFAGVGVGALVMFAIMWGREPDAIVKEKVVTETRIVYRDAAPGSSAPEAASVNAVAAFENNAEEKSAGQRKSTKPKKGRAASRAERKKKLLASLNTGAGTSRRGGDGGGSASGLTSTQMNRVVSKNRSSLQFCYERELKKGTASSFNDIKVTFHVNVGTSGTVTGARISGAGAALPGLKKCLNDAVRRWIFPPASESSSVQFPIVFTPSR